MFQLMDSPVLANQQGLTNIIYVWTLDALKKTDQERWMIGIDGERKGQGTQCDEDPIYPTPPLGQDMTQAQFLSRV